jgi:hypothetical protein
MMSDHPPVDQRLTPPHLSLIALLILTGLCFAFVWGADTILPVRIDEGPLIQMPQPMQTTLVWYTSRPAKCTLHVEGHLSSPISPESSENQQRHTANLGRLSPDTEYAYRITLESGRELFSGTLDSPKDANAPFSFIVFGDSGKGTRAQYALAQQMLERRPDFMLHTGDLVYSDGARHKYPDRFFGPYRKTIARVPFFPCLGNHDIAEDGRALPYESVFELPQNGPDGRPADHEYWFDYGSARFAVFDSNISQAEMESKIAPWLREVFDANAPEWRFISCHHPPYTVGNYTPGDLAVRKTLVPIFEEIGIDAVFCGHDHNYQRLTRLRAGQPDEDGILFIITGAGGARLYEQKQLEATFIEFINTKIHSATQITIVGNKLKLEQFDEQGEVMDQTEMIND